MILSWMKLLRRLIDRIRRPGTMRASGTGPGKNGGRMNENMRATEMMQRGFGYGSWDAPNWFIGQEEGKGPKEQPDNSLRVEAWHKLQRDGLSDCRAFHFEIRERSWHRDHPRLQPTWRPLILLLQTFLNDAVDNERIDKEPLRRYQRDKWGSSGGETCVIELSGTSAKGLAQPVDRETYLQERIVFIGEKLRTHRPTFVVMYGMSRSANWEQLTRLSVEKGEPIMGFSLKKDEPIKVESTVFAMAPHPNTRGRTNDDWIQLGKNLRRATELAE
jgi:hypothetical protein